MRLPLEVHRSVPTAANSHAKQNSSCTSKFQFRRVLRVVPALLLAFATAFAYARNYTTIVVFGDSLSDTGNVADLTGGVVPGPPSNYTLGRFTDGFDTKPPAQNQLWRGVWVEQFAESLLSHPEVRNSLDGGTDYAYGFATTGSGTSTFTFGPSIADSVQVNNIGQQITDYLATHPKINSNTLFIVWGGANDLLNATKPDDIVNAAIRQTLNIQRLIDAGATQFIVANLPPLGLVPRLNGSPATSVPATEASNLYNIYLATGISILRDFYFYRNPTIFQLDVFTLFNEIVASPATFSFANIKSPSQGAVDPVTGQPVDPDTYLFWDDLHPTTHGHNILADSAASLSQQPCNSRGEHCVFPVK